MVSQEMGSKAQPGPGYRSIHRKVLASPVGALRVRPKANKTRMTQDSLWCPFGKSDFAGDFRPDPLDGQLAARFTDQPDKPRFGPARASGLRSLF